jgi:hypothetical protein
MENKMNQAFINEISDILIAVLELDAGPDQDYTLAMALQLVDTL